MQGTKPLCKEELLPEILLLLKTPKGEEEETPANEEEPATGQDATTVPPKATHASAVISAQLVAYLQNAEPPDPREEELSPKIFSSDSMSDVQEKCNPTARTRTAKHKAFFINAPLLIILNHVT
jgi:hypothetical protein